MTKSIILVLLISISGHSQPVQFQTKFSEPFAVFQFVNSLSAGSLNNVYKKLYNGSRFARKEYNDLISQFDSLNLGYNFEFNDYPAGQKVGIDVSSFMKRNLILSESVQDFKLRSMGLVPNEALIKLTLLLKDFTPVYDEVVYQPFKLRFEEQLKGISDLVKAKNLNNLFSEAVQFYRSSWDPSVPFIFCFYPLPHSKGFTATAVSNVAISGIADSLDTYTGLLSVMMHEISHVLYDERPKSFWSEMDGWFVTNPSKVSRYAYSLFNESMATAVGNGYIGGQLNGKEDTARSWYGEKYINAMAKATYPIVKDYIVNHKPIDHDFVNAYIKTYEDKFSGWLTDLNYVMTGAIVVSDDPADFHLVDSLFRFYGHEHVNEISTLSLEKLQANHGTKIIIVNSRNEEKLGVLKRGFKELKEWHPDAGHDFEYTVFLSDKTYLLILNNVNGTTGEKLRSLLIKESN